MVCKIDMEKAYDRVNWGFLEWILIKKGFKERWIKWIMVCISHLGF